MATEPDTLFRIGGDATKLVNAAKKAVKSFRGMATAAAKYGAAAAAAGAAVAAHLVNNARQAIDEQAKLAKQLNTTFASMSNLTRAGELQGVELKTISTAARTLAVRMGEAQQGLASAEDAFTALNINAADLAKLPLDQRIIAVNTAMRENVAESERAAIAADLFGTRASTAMLSLSPEVIQQASDEVEQFGLNLSDVDAQKVEAANDAISAAANVVKGLVQQITVKLAPILEAASKLFIKNAQSAGTMSEKSTRAFNFIIEAAAFAIDAIDGIKRIFQIVADGIIIGAMKIKRHILSPFEALSVVGSKLPGEVGLFFQDVRANIESEMNLAQGVIEEAGRNIDDLLTKPLAGDKFKKFVAEAEEASTKAAEIAVNLQKQQAEGQPTGGDGGASEQDKKRIEARLERLRQSYATEKELQILRTEEELALIQEALDAKLIQQDEYNKRNFEIVNEGQARLNEIERKRSEEREAIAEAERQAKIDLAGSVFSDLSTLMNSESKKLFNIGKKAAIANAAMSTAVGIAKALELPFPANLAAAAVVALKGYQQVSSIRAQQFGGGGAGAQATGSNTTAVNAANTPVNSAPRQETIGVIRIKGAENMGSDMRGFVDTLKSFMDDGARDIIFE